ncbi:MAG: hypothetical protein WC971_08150 [Coriobacteriia bacterium]
MGVFDTFIVWVAGKLLVPLLDRILTSIGHDGSRWVNSLKRFARRKQLEIRVDDDQRLIVRSIIGYQVSYQHVQEALVGRLEGDELLHSVTSLQALGLINQPRLAHPPDPRALLTVSNDAKLLLESRKPHRAPRAHTRDVPEAAVRRQRVADNSQWLLKQDLPRRRADYIPAEWTEEVARREDERAEDEAWLEQRGFGRAHQ